MKSKTKIIIEAILLISTFIAGIVLLFLGLNYKHKVNTYQPVIGYLSYENNDESEVIYYYNVSNKMYKYTTNLESISDENRIIRLKYNPNNPSEVIEENNYFYWYLIGMSVLFMGVPIAFVLLVLHFFNLLPTVKIDVASFSIGLLLLILGVIFLFVFKSTSNEITPIILMALFIIFGIVLIIQSFKLKFHKKETNHNKVNLYNSVYSEVGIPTIIVASLISIIIGICIIYNFSSSFNIFLILGIIFTLIGGLFLFQILFIKIKKKSLTKVEQENEMIASITKTLLFIRKYGGFIGLIFILLLILWIL